MNDKLGAELVRSTGRGVVYITAAKVWFLLAGWILIFALPRIFKWSAGGDETEGQALFGAYKIVFMGVSFINNSIITGTIQAVSKFVSEDESRATAVRRTALRVQGLIGVGLAVAYLAAADCLAHLLGSPDLALLMRISAGVIVAYSCYAVFIGLFNGMRQFNRQALFDVIYTTVKVALIIGLAAAGLRVLGTVLGFLVAATLIAVAAATVAVRGGKGSFPVRPYLSFSALLLGYTFLLNLVLSLDLFLLKGITSSMALDAGASSGAASDLGKVLAGQYAAAQGLAFIPYQAVLAIAFVAFPLVSKVTFAQDTNRSRVYVRTTLRFATILIVGLATVFAALPDRALGLIFEPEYRVAAGALRVLAVGIAAFGLLVVTNTILNGAGHPWRAIGVIGLTLAAVTTGVVLAVRAAGPGPQALVATAAGSAGGMTLGLVVAAVVVYRRFGTFWPALTVLRVACACGAALAVGWALPDAGKLATLGECLIVVAVYFFILVIMREFTHKDLDQLKQVARRGKVR